LNEVAELNGQHVKLDKGEFIWHHHDNEDEMFLVMKGRFRMEFRNRHVWLDEGEFIAAPRGGASKKGNAYSSIRAGVHVEYGRRAGRAHTEKTRENLNTRWG